MGACGYFGHWDACGKQSVIKQWHKAPEMVASILAMNGLSDT
jgi:hypothetical protein